MTDYSKLAEALRYCVNARNCEKCAYRIDNNSVKCRVQRVEDAADAIEKLVTLYEKAEMDATNLTGKLAQAEADIERLKEANEELREKQTYIDHYGDRWMTSAKDVPTSAYEHGYADGRDESEAQLPKRGEWVKGSDGLYHCSECGKTAPYLDAFDGVIQYWEPLFFCNNCGAKMIGEQNVE